MKRVVKRTMTRSIITASQPGSRSKRERSASVYPKDDQDFMLSLARGLSVITSFTETRRSMTMAQISEQACLPRAVVRRCLHTLTLLGYVSLHERQYSLRPKVLRLGHPYLADAPLAQLAQPYLERITSALNESCSLATLDGDKIRYIARSAAKVRIMSVDLQVGSELPAWCTSMGRVLLASLDDAEMEKIIQNTKLTSYTKFTIVGREQLRSTLRRVRRVGYCLVDQELEFGLRSIAVPVRDCEGVVVAALNVGVNAARYSKAQLQETCLPVLKAVSQELGRLLVGSYASTFEQEVR
jgi:IclR family pca regulon transcriptional regulator